MSLLLYSLGDHASTGVFGPFEFTIEGANPGLRGFPKGLKLIPRLGKGAPMVGPNLFTEFIVLNRSHH